MPKEGGGEQNHFSTKKDIISFLNLQVTCVFVLLMILQHPAKRHVEFYVKTASPHKVRSDLLQSSKCSASLSLELSPFPHSSLCSYLSLPSQQTEPSLFQHNHGHKKKIKIKRTLQYWSFLIVQIKHIIHFLS